MIQANFLMGNCSSLKGLEYSLLFICQGLLLNLCGFWPFKIAHFWYSCISTFLSYYHSALFSFFSNFYCFRQFYFHSL